MSMLLHHANRCTTIWKMYRVDESMGPSTGGTEEGEDEGMRLDGQGSSPEQESEGIVIVHGHSRSKQLTWNGSCSSAEEDVIQPCSYRLIFKCTPARLQLASTYHHLQVLWKQ